MNKSILFVSALLLLGTFTVMAGEPPDDNKAADEDTLKEAELPDGWPWALLTVPGKTIYELPVEPPSELAAPELDIQSVRTFQVEKPALHLYLYEFESYGDASDAYDQILEASSSTGRPWHPDLVINGAWLLVVGFPSHKPPSPEMESARTEFVSAFAGEE